MVDSIHPAPPAQPAVTLGRTLRPAGDGVLSALPPGDEGAPYDRRAAAYDRLVASPLYNRLLWRASPRTYAAFAAEALRAGDGPLLDVACGSGVFTAAAYRHADRPLVLADRSLAMLGRARGRLGLAAPEVSFMQADLFDLPFAAGAFETVACHGALHVFDDLPKALRRCTPSSRPAAPCTSPHWSRRHPSPPATWLSCTVLARSQRRAGRLTYWPTRAPSSATSPRAATAPCASSPPAPDPPGRLGILDAGRPLT